VEEGRLGDPPLALAADARNVWIGTALGLSRWDRERRRWTEYGLADGLPDLPVTALELQGDGILWISTPGGAVRLDYGAAGGR
jgi:ligand-binding sensor domain-containing protein